MKTILHCFLIFAALCCSTSADAKVFPFLINGENYFNQDSIPLSAHDYVLDAYYNIRFDNDELIVRCPWKCTVTVNGKEDQVRMIYDKSYPGSPYSYRISNPRRKQNIRIYYNRVIKFPFSIFVHEKIPYGTTSVEEVKSASPADNQAYDLNGREVGTKPRGIYIIDGKKVLKK